MSKPPTAKWMKLCADSSGTTRSLGWLAFQARAEVVFENLDPYAHTVTSADDSAVAFDSGER